MDEQKLWSIVGFAMRDLNIPYSILNCLLLSLPFPSTPSPPPHITRLFLLRRLFALISSHGSIDTLKTLTTLERLLPPSPSSPSVSICRAYSSVLFYLSLSPNVSSLHVASAINRICRYEFHTEILGPWKRMLKRVDGTGNFAADHLVSARNNAIWAVKEFLDEEFAAMEPPFLLRKVEEWSKENKKVETEIPTTSSDKGLDENHDLSKEEDKLDTEKRKISEAMNRIRSSAEKLEENQSISKGKCKLNGKNGTERDGASTGDTGTKPFNLLNRSFEKVLGDNRDRTREEIRETNKVDNVNAPSTSNINRETQNCVKPSLMDRNPTAHTFEWNDSMEDDPELERTSPRIPRRASRRFTDANVRVRKRRQVVRWKPHEEEALRKAVKEVGKGRWKEILYRYPNEFKDRTEVDLKDKWRNMSRS